MRGSVKVSRQCAQLRTPYGGKAVQTYARERRQQRVVRHEMGNAEPERGAW